MNLPRVNLNQVHLSLLYFGSSLTKRGQLKLLSLLKQTQLTSIHWLHRYSSGPSLYLDTVRPRDFSWVIPFLYGTDKYGRWAVSTCIRITTHDGNELYRGILTVFQRYDNESSLFVCRGYNEKLGDLDSPLWKVLELVTNLVTAVAYERLEALFRTGELRHEKFIVYIINASEL